MTGSVDHNDPTDTWLVAYLDGVLDEQQVTELRQVLAGNAELMHRLALLRNGSRDFKGAFEPLLDLAPDQKMQAMLSGLIVQSAPQPGTPSQADNVVPLRPVRQSMWRGFAGLAAAAGIAVAVFSGGVYTGWQTGEQPPLQTTTIGWRQAAAQYVSLYSKQTLAGYPVDPAAKKKGWQRISQALGLQLTGKKARIDDLALKGTQILQLKGKPLVQIAYLHKGETPVALCIIKSKGRSAGQKTEQRLGTEYCPLGRGRLWFYADRKSAARGAAKDRCSPYRALFLITFFLVTFFLVVRLDRIFPSPDSPWEI